MSDTPRTDSNYIGMQIVPAVFAQQLERELNEANERIKQLEAKCFESTQDGKALAEMLRIVDDKTMTDHIPDAEKMIHDTPRADKAYNSGNWNWGIYQEARLLEKEMNAYKVHVEFQYKRIKQLEDIIKRASIRFFQDGSDGKTTCQMLAILDEARK